MEKKYFAVRKGDSTWVMYETYAEVQKRKLQVLKSFKTEAEAKDYLNAADACKSIDITKADAIIYSDGSSNFDFPIEKFTQEQLYVSYGLVIFFKENNEVYYETGKLIDGQGERISNEGFTEHNFYAWRYGMHCERVNKAMEAIAQDAAPEEFWYRDVYRDKKGESEEKNRRSHKFVLASSSDVGEVEGVKRGVEICLEEKKLKNVVVVYDAEAIPPIFNGGGDKNKKNEVCFYGNICERYRNKVQFMKVKSHASADETGESFVHGVYNDCADILAKAETDNKPIGRKIDKNGNKKRVNPNLEKVLGYDITDKVTVNDVNKRRKETRALVEEAVRKEICVFAK